MRSPERIEWWRVPKAREITNAAATTLVLKRFMGTRARVKEMTPSMTGPRTSKNVMGRNRFLVKSGGLSRYIHASASRPLRRSPTPVAFRSFTSLTPLRGRSLRGAIWPLLIDGLGRA